MRTPIQRGFGLVEAMVTIAVLAILLAVAVPSFQQMIVNGRTRTIAESFRAGVDLARTEAMRRNLPVGFAVVSAVTACSARSISPGARCNWDARARAIVRCRSACIGNWPTSTNCRATRPRR